MTCQGDEHGINFTEEENTSIECFPILPACFCSVFILMVGVYSQIRQSGLEISPLLSRKSNGISPHCHTVMSLTFL